ncbi:MAG: DUF418 domain-containing protein [Bacteroidetes bacterium]|nr:DUF418 domain-containing protein [Bacteroidota bacterium]
MTMISPTSILAPVGAKISAPIGANQRIQFLDALRGMAVFGILIMNIMSMGQPVYFYDMMDMRQPVSGANLWAWLLESGLFEGAMRGMFSLLFGAGTILLLERLERTDRGTGPADVYYRRILLLIGLGLFNSWVLLWFGDILYLYGISALLIFPFRKLSPKQLLIPISIVLVQGVAQESMRLHSSQETITKGRQAEALKARKQKLTEAQQADLDKYEGFVKQHSKEGVAQSAEKMTGKLQSRNLSTIVSYIWGWNSTFDKVAIYDLSDMLVFFFIGMALFKWGFFEGRLRNSTYWVIALVGVGIGLGINYFRISDNYNSRFDYVKIVEKSWPVATYQLRRVFQVVGYLSVLVLLYKNNIFRRCFDLLAPVGKMALTNYLLQSLIAEILFYGCGVYGRLQRYQLLEVTAAVWVFEGVLSHVWMRYFYFGPVEWAWRSLTYLKKQPMRKAAMP